MVERVISYCNIKTIGRLPFVNVASSEGEILQQLLDWACQRPRSTIALFRSGLPPVSHLSNQPTICSRRSTRCHSWPERESSRDSPGNFTITVGMLRNFKGRGFEPRWLKEGELGHVPPLLPAGNVALGTARGEAQCVAGDDRVGKRAAAAGHASFLSSKPDIPRIIYRI